MHHLSTSGNSGPFSPSCAFCKVECEASFPDMFESYDFFDSASNAIIVFFFPLASGLKEKIARFSRPRFCSPKAQRLLGKPQAGEPSH